MIPIDETTEDETSLSEEDTGGEEDEASEDISELQPEPSKPQPVPKKPKPQVKPFERSDSIYLATVRYKSLGLPANQKRLSSSKKKEIVEKLAANSEKMKSVRFCFDYENEKN